MIDVLRLDLVRAGKALPLHDRPEEIAASPIVSDVRQIGGAKLYCGDCMLIAPLLTGIDAVVTDPPYGMGWDIDSRQFRGGNRKKNQGRSDYPAIKGDDQPFDPSPWLHYHETVLWGSNHYAQRLPVGTTLVWLKKTPASYGTFLSDAEIGWKKHGVGAFVFNAPDNNGRRIKEGTGHGVGRGVHPMQKPIALMEWCIAKVKGRVILDPYMGSGTTGVAALKGGRSFVGIEIEPRYFAAAVARLERQVRSPALFETPPQFVEEPSMGGA